jgi:AcrR family transcriptional regulator
MTTDDLTPQPPLSTTLEREQERSTVTTAADDDLFALGDDVSTEKQRRILQAAVDVFAERGFAGTPTAEIAKRAGVAEGTIFKHYKTKKDLLLGVVAPLFAKLVAPKFIAPVREILRAPHDSVESLLRALVRERVSFVRQHQRMIRIVLQEISFHPELRDLIARTAGPLVLDDAVAVIARLQREGKVRAAEPTSIIRIVVGTLMSFALTRFVLFPDREWDDDAEAELMVAVLARGLAP